MDDNKELTQYVLEFQNGNKDAFQKIYELSYRKVYFTALKLCKNEDDAEDVLQDSYIQVMNKISGLKNPNSFIGWLNVIVANNARSMLRKNNPKLFDSTENEEYVLDSIEDTDEEYHPSEDVEKDELRAEIMGLIDNLSDEKRAAVILYYYNEMTTKQIAQSLDSNENTIKSRLVQAKKDLTKGVQELEKQNKKLRGVAPMPLILWAIRDSAKKSTEAFTLSGGAAATYTAITATTGITAAGAATAGGIIAKTAGFSVAQKVISGIVIAGVVTGGAVGTKEIIEKKGGEENNTTAVVAETIEQTAKSITEQATTDFVFESTSETGLTIPKSTSQTQTNESATKSETQTELSTSATTSTVVPGAVSSTRVTSTTRTTTKTTTKATTKATTKSTTKATTTKATTKETTLGKATVSITLYEAGNLKQTKTISIDEGSSFSRADAANSMGVDAADVHFRRGSGISNAQAGEIYSFVIDS